MQFMNNFLVVDRFVYMIELVSYKVLKNPFVEICCHMISFRNDICKKLSFDLLFLCAYVILYTLL